MRGCSILFAVILVILTIPSVQAETMDDEETSIIVEVDGDPSEQERRIEADYPSVTVVEVYDTLFNGLALEARPRDLAKVVHQDFIQATHSVQYYQTQANETKMKRDQPPEQADFNPTTYTGKDIKVGVVDTGIDEEHPDLIKSFAGGYDLVDFDEDPHETLPDEGMPTMHGTHVAGIIAANGEKKGVAPDADLYAYRALGPGGIGSSIQVLAALERAVKDGMDVINLSLGNTINAPDYPTSIAVNKASALGTAVVIAGGNAGPDDWTVGSPGTAKDALVVGALQLPEEQAFLQITKDDKQIPLQQLQVTAPWQLSKDYQVTDHCDSREDTTGKIAVLDEAAVKERDWLKQCEKHDAVAIILREKAGMYLQVNQNIPDETSIPIAFIASENESYIEEAIKEKRFLETTYETSNLSLADFSSRGPVTNSWEIKPDVLAPGVNIKSTVPGGYMALSGTSMATPHVAGAIAILKEARPDWSNKQIISALKTTAKLVENKDSLLRGTEQGMGEVDIESAIQTETIIHDPQLSFGVINDFMKKKEHTMTVENVTKKTKTYSFTIPHKEKGITWDLPQTFEVEPNEEKEISIKAAINPIELETGTHQGWMKLESKEEEFHLPYLFINEAADYPKTMGFDLTLEPFSDDTYTYQFYASESLKRMEVNVYNADTFVYDHTLLELTDVAKGMNEGERKASDIGEPGAYIAFITIEQEDGTFKTIQQPLIIE